MKGPRGGWAKAAGDGGAPLLSRPEWNQRVRQDAARKVLGAALLAGATGAGLRGVLGARYLFGAPQLTPPRGVAAGTVDVPEPYYTDPAERREGLATRPKKPKPAPAGGILGLLGGAKRAEADAPAGPVGNIAQGRSALEPGQVPWFWPGIGLGVVGGSILGYRGMDRFMDSLRKKQLDEEVQQAREEYQRALLAQYDPATVPLAGPGGRKAAAADDDPATALGRDLDRLVRELVKRAELEGEGASPDYVDSWTNRNLGSLLGLYGLAAAPAALLTGMAAYKYTRDRSTSKLVEEAVKTRERERVLRRPPEVFVRPVPVHVNRRRQVDPVGSPEATPYA